jgi:SAM-dependent methyltransferase
MLGADWVREAVNLEVRAGTGVDVVGDGHELPFLDGSMDAVVAQAVLEHVENPRAVVAEAMRVLRPGGLVYAEIPFLQCYHPHPTDYTRLTIDGVDALFGGFDRLESGVCVGPSSMMSDMMKYYMALVGSFGSETLFHVLHRGLGWVTFPLKYLDVVLSRGPNAAYMASGFYFLGRKPSTGGR